MQVDPDVVITAQEGAKVSHKGATTLMVTIHGDAGQEETIEVPPNTVVNWKPPSGWRSARFTASGHAEEFRLIEQAEAAG